MLRTRLLPLALAASASTGLLASASSASARPATARAASRGSVKVLYAASLEALMNDRVGPAFHRATGYTLEGFPAGSNALASEIKGGVQQGDVFISAAPSVNATLEGRGNGNWVSWYAPFAVTKLVIGYNPHSRFARALRTQPWYKVITRPGFRLGFTDPKLDPKGVLAVDALRAAASRYRVPALRKIATDQSDVFPEQDLVGRLQAGQLDAGFFYTVEASAARIPSVTIYPIQQYATFTISVLNRAPDTGGAAAFVRFLLGSTGRSEMRSVGLAVDATPKAVGRGLPSSLAGVIRR